MNRFYKLMLGAISITFIIAVIYTYAPIYNNDIHIELLEVSDEPNVDSRNELTIYQRSKFKTPVRGEKNIIFLETSCIASENGYDKVDAKIVLNHQRSCAVESAAKMNPDSQVYVFYTCPLDPDSLSRSGQLATRLFQYPNVFVWHETMYDLFLGTPLEAFLASKQLLKSSFPTTHGSDVLRFLMLWKFGGTYLDLDFIVMRSLADLGSNFVGVECCGYLNSAAVNFGTDPLGMEIADECMKEISTNFKGDSWGHNGPALITRVLRKKCDINETEQMTIEACQGFSVLPHNVFYPIIYQWKLYYDEAKSETTMKEILTGHALHLWNSLMGWEGGGTMIRDSQQPIVLLEKEYCPVTYAITKETDAEMSTTLTTTSSTTTSATTTTVTTTTTITTVSVTSDAAQKTTLPTEAAMLKTTVEISNDVES